MLHVYHATELTLQTIVISFTAWTVTSASGLATLDTIIRILDRANQFAETASGLLRNLVMTQTQYPLTDALTVAR